MRRGGRLGISGRGHWAASGKGKGASLRLPARTGVARVWMAGQRVPTVGTALVLEMWSHWGRLVAIVRFVLALVVGPLVDFLHAKPWGLHLGQVVQGSLHLHSHLVHVTAFLHAGHVSARARV